MSKTLQQEIANGITQKFKDAVVKKIDKDNYLDIHLPSVHLKKGTHLGINTAKGEIKIVFYCREDDFNTLALNNSKKIEEYAQGLRIKNNPAFNDASKAIEAAIDFVMELMKVNGNSSKSDTSETKTKIAVPKKAVPKKAAQKKDFKPIEEDEVEEISDENVDNEQDSGELNDLFSKILGGNFKVNFVTNRPDLIAAVADKDDLKEVKRIIKEGNTDINVRDSGEDAYTAVHFAAWDGKVEILKYLIKAGADTDIVGNDGRTALHLAAVLGHVETVEALLKAGVDIERRIPGGNKYFSKEGATALRDALISQRWEVVEMLIDAGADISCLNEPCKEALSGKNDLFDVIRLLNEDGEYSNGEFDEAKLGELENKVKGIEEEEIEEDEEVSDENEESDLSNFDIKEDSVIKYICDKIKREKYLTNLLYVNKALDSKGYVIDKHQAYFFDSNVLISDKELEGFLVVNMDGFYSNCINEDEMQMIFSWSGVNDLEYQEDGDECSIDIIANQGRLTIKKVESHSLKILYTFYKHVWKAINDKFKDEPFIVWNDVWKMGINEVGFTDFIDYYTFDVTSTDDDIDEEENEEEADDANAKYNVYISTITLNKLVLVKYLSEFMKMTFEEAKEIVDKYEWIILGKELDIETAEKIKKVAENNTGCEVLIKSLTELNNVEDGEEDEEEEVDDSEDDDNSNEDATLFYIGQSYEKQYLRFQEIADKTGILINKIKTEPNSNERDELWDIMRVFTKRIYQLDAEKNPNKEELNTLCFHSIVALHWCDIYITDKRFSFTNGRFRRDVLALALCFYARIDRSYEYYDHVKIQFIMPHMQFSVLLWSINSIVNLGQDNLFGMFTQEQAQKAQQLFTEMDKQNQATGGYGYVDPRKMPDNHPLQAIWREVFSLFNNVRIPYQFIRMYISLELPKRSFLQGLFSGKGNNDPGVNVTLLEEDKQKNIAFLDNQIIHKQFPDDWNLYEDFSFIYIYFSTNTDGNFSKKEKESIESLVAEWIGEEDETILRKMTSDAIKNAQEAFNKDNSNDRFAFALENIRRHFYVKLDYDQEKTENQLKLILNDFLAIAESDGEIKTEELDFINLLKMEWGIEGESDEEENEEENEDDEEEEKLKAILKKYGVDSESELTSLTVEQAKELSGYKGYVLDLSGLTSLSEKSAEILAKHKGNLMLDGLTSISDKALESIASHSGGYLSLDGLTNLSDKALQILSQHKELLYLSGLTSLSDKAASILSKHKGSLALDGLTELSEKAIEILASHQGGYLSLDGLTYLSDKSLEVLAKHDGTLYLNGLTSLSDKAALALANHKDELFLNGVKTLSDKAAFALAKHEGELNMDGLTSLSDKAAEALAEKGIKIDEEDESEEDEENNNDGEFDEFYKRYFDEFYTDNLWNRHKDEVEFEIKPFPGTLNSSSYDHINSSDYELLFRKFTKSEVELIVNKIKKSKTYFRLPFVKQCLSGKMNLNEKEPFWFIPLVGYGYGIGSLLYFNQDGIQNIDSDSASFDNFIHVDLWKNLDVKSGYNGLMEEYDFEDYKEDDNSISSLKIDFFNPSTGNSGSVNIVEFHGENYGSTLRIVKALWDYAWKAIVEANRGRSVFILNLPKMPLPVSFNSWEELIEWSKN
jgi:hypothetical protein